MELIFPWPAKIFLTLNCLILGDFLMTQQVQ